MMTSHRDFPSAAMWFRNHGAVRESQVRKNALNNTRTRIS